MTSEDDAQELKKEELIEKGLPLDWLVRAHRATTMETLVYLCHQRHKWINEDQKIILTILQDYEKSGGGMIAENNPPPLRRKRGKHIPASKFESVMEHQEIYVFSCQLFDLVREEPSTWDKLNCSDFGYHQPMRQAWCSISLKLGGWGAIQHVHMLKQLYRRRRDQYNIDFLRLGKPFQYSEKLSFLKNVLEMSKSDSLNPDISLQDHIDASEPKIEYEEEVKGAPVHIQNILRQVSEKIDQVAALNRPEVLAQYLSKCCNQVVANREKLASSGLQDKEWIDIRTSDSQLD
ncbi:hypothetical protein CRE_03950 [Caenorhabditis remanei]|uniref:MADF domain-containing protein n=1 Tax=Caenorhabditis remanei TaxID=31234 RepID=E3LY09_CAERE|nr:hypothetical protein CRE_03950 [Caenorhabditis remanei]